MLRAVEFGLLAVTLLVIFGLIVVGPGAYSQTAEDTDPELATEAGTAPASTPKPNLR